MVEEGLFRADLYYRLNVLPIRLPPLRERLGDLEALAEVLMEDIARRSGLPPRSLAPDAVDLLARQRWSGNIRELRNTLEQAALMTDDLVLGAQHLALPVEPGTAAPQPQAATRASAADALTLVLQQPASALDPLQPLAEQIACTERRAIAAAMQRSAGNRVAAARLLGMPRSVLYERLARYPELATH